VSLTFEGPKGSFERRWVVYAMLRDNVQHHLEGGEPTTDFRRLHSLGEALSTGSVSVPALELRTELGRLDGLLALPISRLAISLRTRAVHTLSFPLPDLRATSLVSTVGWAPPFPLAGAHTLSDAFGSLVVELRRITDGAAPGDEVTVTDS
jgi:hypothetical protein